MTTQKTNKKNVAKKQQPQQQANEADERLIKRNSQSQKGGKKKAKRNSLIVDENNNNTATTTTTTTESNGNIKLVNQEAEQEQQPPDRVLKESSSNGISNGNHTKLNHSSNQHPLDNSTEAGENFQHYHTQLHSTSNGLLKTEVEAALDLTTPNDQESLSLTGKASGGSSELASINGASTISLADENPKWWANGAGKCVTSSRNHLDYIDDDVDISKQQNKNNNNNNNLRLKLGLFLLFVIALKAGLFDGEGQKLERLIKLKELERKMRPVDPLFNYVQFRERFPRNKATMRPQLPSEHSNRFLQFNNDLISIARHNMAYMMHKQPYALRQSPFKSDRTFMEQLDVLSQLDEFDLEKILVMLRYEKQQELEVRAYIDSALSGMPTTQQQQQQQDSSPLTTTNVELENSRFKMWFSRATKGRAHFEVPSYPLNAQPDPERVTHIDADLRQRSGPIKDMKACGACYAFSYVSLVEWHYNAQLAAGGKMLPASQPSRDELEGGQMLDLSEQQIVDCGHVARLGGCHSGYLVDVVNFSNVFGLELESQYPYTGRESTCKRREGRFKLRTVDFKRIIVDRTEWERVLEEQPILLEAHLPSDILSYKRGIHPGQNCNSKQPHGMLLVGHGRQDGQAYWLLKNSMGSNWGENGYLRLSRDAPMRECFRTGFISKFKFRALDEESYYKLYDQFKFEPTEHVIGNAAATATESGASNKRNKRMEGEGEEQEDGAQRISVGAESKLE